MKINEAIAKRINDLCNDKELANKVANCNNISTNKLASISLLTQSTVQHLTDGRSKNPKILTIARIYSNGFGMKLEEMTTDDIMITGQIESIDFEKTVDEGEGT